jgi:DNA modification methylase
MVLVFREVRRVLRDDGTCWINYGDTYSGGTGGQRDFSSSTLKMDGRSEESRLRTLNERAKELNRPQLIGKANTGLPPGNLVGVPWRIALALQADGWVLRQDIIWHKPSPMPESVTNRCTKAHEHVFLFAKSNRYYYDAEAIKETGACKELTEEEHEDVLESNSKEGNSDRYQRKKSKIADGSKSGNQFGRFSPPGGRNKRSVWTVSSQGYPGAHFAVFPPKLIEPCILAGTSAKGACAECGAPWRRVVEKRQLLRDRPNEYVKYAEERGVKSGLNKDRRDGGRSNVGGNFHGGGKGSGGNRNDDDRGTANPRSTVNTCANTVAGVETETMGWRPTCECHGELVRRRVTVLGRGAYHDHSADGVEHSLRQGGRGPLSFDGRPSEAGKRTEPAKELQKTVVEHVSDLPLEDHPVVPCTVLDPFVGSGTTAVVCLTLGRRCVGIDLSEKYLRANAVPRIEGVLSRSPATAHLAGRKVKACGLGRAK